MIKEVLMPKISEDVESGDVVKVLVNVGDLLETDQPLAELETDKAVFEVPSPLKGKVVEINIKEGDKVKTGQIVLKLEV